MNDFLFQLIKIALGNADSLSRSLDDREWKRLFEESVKQSLVGICYAGIVQLPKEQQPPLEVLMEWIGLSERIKTSNNVMNKKCADLYSLIKRANYDSCILKGQSVAYLYGNLRLYRQPGDIDLWMISTPGNVIEWIRSTGLQYNYDYHHADVSFFPNIDVEVHYRPTLSRNFVRNYRLQKWFRNNGSKHIFYNTELGFTIPDYIFNVVLILNHNYWHLLYEGIGLRQFLDLYFVLKNVGNVDDFRETNRLINYFGLKSFSEASMWIMKEVFELEDKFLISKPNKNSGIFLLSEVMQAGNFGQYDDRIDEKRHSYTRIRLMYAWMRHNLRLIRQYPVDVLWTPLGIMGISFWRMRYRICVFARKLLQEIV